MPELPEVETTMRCMRSEFLGYKISSVKFFRKDLRDPMPIRRIKAVGVGAKIEDFERRGKYILMHAGAHSIVLHLGMTGNVLARGEAKPSQKHTHFVWEMQSPRKSSKKKKYLHYVDPRRFGRLDILPRHSWQEHAYFSSMGPEPLEARGLGSLIHKKSTGRKAPVKAFLMDQRTVVGVGNIYACEALFLAGIHPQTPAGSLDLGSYKEVSRHIKKVLKKAILQGGTSFRDFKHLDGKASGYFQIRLAVYNRKGQECKSCGEHIENVVIAGRSSFYCPRCQSL